MGALQHGWCKLVQPFGEQVSIVHVGWRGTLWGTPILPVAETHAHVPQRHT